MSPLRNTVTLLCKDCSFTLLYGWRSGLFLASIRKQCVQGAGEKGATSEDESFLTTSGNVLRMYRHFHRQVNPLL